MNPMYWIDVNQYLPGMKITDVLVRLDNGEKHLLLGRDIGGLWLAKDGRTTCVVTHWMEIKEPAK